MKADRSSTSGTTSRFTSSTLRPTPTPTALSNLRVQLEQYYQDNRAYGVTTTAVCGITVPTAVNTAPWNNKFFTASCVTSNAGQNYLLTVTGSSQLPGFAFTLTDANVRGTTTFKGAAVTKACWLVKGSEC